MQENNIFTRRNIYSIHYIMRTQYARNIKDYFFSILMFVQ